MKDLLAMYGHNDQITVSLYNYIEEIHSPYKTLLDYHHDGTLTKHGFQLMSYCKNGQDHYCSSFNGIQLIPLTYSYMHSWGEYEIMMSPRALYKAKLTNFITINKNKITFREVPGYFIITLINSNNHYNFP